MDDLSEIEKLANGLLKRTAPTERRRLLRSMARKVQASQRARIGRQQDPDGARYAPRRERKVRPGNYALKFLYPKGAAEPRLVLMKSWVKQGPLITGYDIERKAIRSFFWDRVAEFLPVADDEQNAGGGKRRGGRVRDKIMFMKLSRPRFLKADATEDEAWVGFDGRASAIAETHQEGRTDRPAPKAKPVRYARRVLLGLTSAEEAELLNMLLAHVAG